MIELIHAISLINSQPFFNPLKFLKLLLKGKKKSIESQSGNGACRWLTFGQWLLFIGLSVEKVEWKECVHSISLLRSYLCRGSISPSADAKPLNGGHQWFRLDFPSCAEVWHCQPYWCRNTGTVLTCWFLPELKTTRNLNCRNKRLNILSAPSAKCTVYSICWGLEPLPLTSPRFASHSVYLSDFASCLPFHHILHPLPSSPAFSLKHAWKAEPKCHKTNMIPSE